MRKLAMALAFSRSLHQPQAAAAISHLTSVSVRTMSSQKDLRLRQLTGEKQLQQQISAAFTGKDLSGPKEKQHRPMLVIDLCSLLKDLNVLAAAPTTALINTARIKGGLVNWAQCYTSANTFFENKTEKSHPHINDGHRSSLTTIQRAALNPLFRRIFSSLVRSHNSVHTRGFKTTERHGCSPENKTGRPRSKTKVKFDEVYKARKAATNISSASAEKMLLNMMSMLLLQASFMALSCFLLFYLFKTYIISYRPIKSEDVTVTSADVKGAAEAKQELKDIERLFLRVLRDLDKYTSRAAKLPKGGSLDFHNSITYEVNAEAVNVTFADVKGAAEAKQELQDIVSFLRDPDKYTSLGAKLPKGVLLVGPPGVGKTLLARAVAGEAGVPFFHTSGSVFDEMFVGLGASRIRKLFAASKKHTPCIIFIDEFDSVGANRTSSAIHPYANQTVTQLLNEMDGFQQNEGIIVMGATNKVDNMDKALRRPGRFDVEVTLTLPDLKDRKEIIELYISKIKKDPDVDVEKLARGTTGFSGAELENLINQAALKAVIDGRDTVTMNFLEYARDKILMGPERKNRIPDEDTNWVTAHHEAGHTLVAYYTKDATPLHKVTIIPRGQSLGHTSFMDEKEIYNRTFSQLKASLDTLMGGRAAEELIYGTERVTTGASSDLQKASTIATSMVTTMGMSDKVGLRFFVEADSRISEISPAQREVIDQEIKRFLQESYDRAKSILKQHNSELVNLAQALIKYETLDRDEIQTVVEGKKLNKPI